MLNHIIKIFVEDANRIVAQRRIHRIICTDKVKFFSAKLVFKVDIHVKVKRAEIVIASKAI